MCNSMNFGSFICLCGHLPKQNIECFYHCIMFLMSLPVSSHPIDNYFLVSITMYCFLPLLGLHVHENKCYIFFSVWLLSPNITFWRLHLCCCLLLILSYCQGAVFHYMIVSIYQSIYLFRDI